jgi:pimeloyl-ACP methyl ester carboxylesterase
MPESAVTFFNRDGVKLAGVLNLPDSAGAASPRPAVLLCQGLSGVKHLVLPEVAAGFAAQGLATLRFDYAGYGESEGDRGWIDPPARVDDALYAIAWLKSQEGIDGARVGAYGHSYGGPVAISLASREPKVRAVVSVSGSGDGAWMLSSIRTSRDWVAFKHRIEEERAKVATTGQSTLVDITEILPFSRAFFAANEKLKVLAGETAADIGTTMFRFASVDAMLDFHPGDAARRLGGRPLLLVHGEEDDAAVIESVAPIYANAPGPKKWIIMPGAGHGDLDAGPDLVSAIGFAADWFGEHLKGHDAS